MAMAKYIVRMTIEVREEAQDEDEALELAKLNFNYSDLHYADVEIEELRNV
jgi:hypothetical protein|tara:strand:+ start:140 stop:292 length:153 start_codon:yes stop_codon:yes gene_type:complete